jgi:hypothetical protein
VIKTIKFSALKKPYSIGRNTSSNKLILQAKCQIQKKDWSAGAGMEGRKV